jgi:hypothetical protein
MMSPDPARWTQFERACAHAVGGGIIAAALIDREANVVALAGTLADTDVRAIVGVLSESLKGDELARVLFAGGRFEFALDQQTVCVRVAARCVFVAVVISDASVATDRRAESLHLETERIVRELFGDELSPPRGPGSGGSASGPAELPLLELGVTPGVKRN